MGEIDPSTGSTILVNILLALFFVVTPAVVIGCCRRWAVARQIGPLLLCYLIGALVGNSGLLPEGATAVQSTLCDLAVPLAIPMMLFSCDFKKFSVKTSLVAVVVGVVAVVITVVSGYFIFAPHLGEQAPAIAGSLIGTFTGGTPNLISLKEMLLLNNETFLTMTTFDIFICFLYLIFLMSVGVKLGRRWLGRGNHVEAEVAVEREADLYRGFGSRQSVIQLLKIAGATLVVVALSLGVATLAQRFNANIFMLVLFLTLTTLSLLLTSWREVKSWDKSYDAGMYIVYIFSVAIASSADLSRLDLEGSAYLFLYQLYGVGVSLLLTLALGKLARLDGDTAIMTSNTMINSPALVPIIAASMKNRDMLIVGISIGLVGYAIGNYLGYLLFIALGGSF